MISEIAVSHTSLLCRLRTLVLVLYYIYTYRDGGLRQLLFTVLLPIIKLSIFSTEESRKPPSPNSTCIKELSTLLYKQRRSQPATTTTTTTRIETTEPYP